MNPILRNILAVVAGIVVGMVVNGGLVQIGPLVIPSPDGIDPSDMESLKANAHLLEFKHFIFPFLAHALGTLFAAFVAAKIATTKKMIFAMVFGVFFLIGGIVASLMIPAPTYFILLDLALAYIPMAFIGGKLAGAGKE